MELGPVPLGWFLGRWFPVPRAWGCGHGRVCCCAPGFSWMLVRR